MAKILKSLQSEGGFSVSEETIIDSTRNILKANSVQVVKSTFADANKIFKTKHNQNCQRRHFRWGGVLLKTLRFEPSNLFFDLF